MNICFNDTNDNSSTFNADIIDYCATFDYNGSVGIGNKNPMDDGGDTTFLCVGNADVAGSAPRLVFGKRFPNLTGFRNCMVMMILFGFS